MDYRVSVVIATRNRPDKLAATLDRLAALRPVPPIIVVDNASDTDPGRVLRHPTRPGLIRQQRNRGSAARTIGARATTTPYVAFCDDDSWWAPGALTVAANLLDQHRWLALVAARVLVEPGGQPDPVSTAMADSPLPDQTGLPGRPVLSCLARASVVRRGAFLAAGGFGELLSTDGVETRLCYDLVAAGWQVRFVPDVVAHHRPSSQRPTDSRHAARTLAQD